MTKAKGPAAGGVKKKQVNGDYKKRRKSAPSEATLAKRSADKEKTRAAREKAAAGPRPKPKPSTKPQHVKNYHPEGGASPSCEPGWKMVWMNKSYRVSACGYRTVQMKMMRFEKGRKNGHWLKLKVMKHKT